MKSAIVIRWRVAVVCMCMILLSCSPKKEKIPLGSEAPEEPFQEIDQSTLFFFGGSHTKWKLEADYMRKPLGDTGTVFATPVRLTLFDSANGTTSIVLADSGTTNPEMTRMTVWGNVYVRTTDSLIVNAEKLWWNKEKAKIFSDSYVRIRTQNGDVLRGKGLEATETFSRWSLKENVSGTFPNFRDRFETGENETGESGEE